MNKPIEFAAIKYELIDSKVHVTRVGRIHPVPEQDCFGRDVTIYMNNRIPFDGKWRCVMLNPKKEYFDKPSGLFVRNVPQAIELQWLDKFDAVVLTIELDDHIEEILNHNYTVWAEAGTAAYKQVYGLLEAVGVRDDQMLKINQGQRQLDPTVLPDF